MESGSGHEGLLSRLITTTTTGKEPEKLGVDDMLQKYSGELGRWQIKHFILTNLAWALEAFHTMVMIFSEREPSWRCIATTGCSSSICDMERSAWSWIGGSDTSIITEWGLVCKEKYKIALVQSLFFTGCMFGAGIFGHLSDSFLGRKGVLTVVCTMNAVFGILTAFSPSYTIYAVLRFLTGVSTGGVGLSAFVLSTEPIGPTKRGAAGMSTFYFFSIGIATLSAIAYFFPAWRHLYIATSIPSILYLIFVVPFITESPRWYLIRGRIDDATKVMHSITITNGNNPLGSQVSLTMDVQTDELVSESLVDVVKSPITCMRLLLSVSINFLVSIVYYGLSLNVVNLGTNIYLNVVINALAEIPAFGLTALLLDKFGRKRMAIGTLWFSALFCSIGSLLNPGGSNLIKTVRMFCGVLGIFGVAATYNLLFIYMMELFPTVVRNAALGCASLAGQMGAILSPVYVVLGGSVPFTIFGISGLIAGILVFYLPETTNKPLYDTLAGLKEGEKVEEDIQKEAENALRSSHYPPFP